MAFTHKHAITATALFVAAIALGLFLGYEDRLPFPSAASAADCSDFSGDEGVCASTDGCTADYAYNCSGQNEEQCNDTAGEGCFAVYGDCSAYNDDEGSCSAAGCSFIADICENYAGNEGGCNAAGCSYDNELEQCFGTSSLGTCDGALFDYCDGSMGEYMGCSGSYTIETVCGDNVTEGLEFCDDGNTDDGDGCSASCYGEAATSLGGHEYTYYQTSLTVDFATASDYCENRGGYLMSVGSEEENELALNYDEVWIGLNDIESDGDFVWTNGEGVAFTDWYPGEPNDGGGANCVTVGDASRDGWFDTPCESGKDFICEVGNDVCGDGVISGDEQCDDGSMLDIVDGCTASCEIDAGWSCDGEPSVCVEDAVCGNGNVETGEACDDGNDDEEDGCDTTCAVSDGYLCASAATNYDDHSHYAFPVQNTLWESARTYCEQMGGYLSVITSSGESAIVNSIAGHDYWIGAFTENAGGTTGYQWVTGEPFSYTNWAGSEPSANQRYVLMNHVNFSPNDGKWSNSNNDGDGINQGFVCEFVGDPLISCKELCGDGMIVGDEQCEDGNDVDGDGCDASCQIESGWNCDGLPSTCQRAEICGDGYIIGTEQCDDGNFFGGDGCSGTCAIESGWSCEGEPSICAEDPVCGNGAVEDGELCDDGGTADGDGCSNVCTVEAGWSCEGGPSLCGPACGDGAVIGGETCDDGNTASGDGCSDSCAVESGWGCVAEPSVCAEASSFTGVWIENVNGDSDGMADFVNGGFPGSFFSASFVDAEAADRTASMSNIDASWNVMARGVGGMAFLSITSVDPNSSIGLIFGTSLVTGSYEVNLGEQVTLTFSPPGAPVCGNTLFEGGGEQCDDGNIVNGDGCDEYCAIEAGYSCDGGSPTACTEAASSGSSSSSTSSSPSSSSSSLTSGSSSAIASSSVSSDPAEPQGGGGGRGGARDSVRAPAEGRATGVMSQTAGEKPVAHPSAPAQTLRDVETADAARKDIERLTKKGIMTGYADATGRSKGVFGSSDPLTYGQVAKIAVLMGGIDPLESGTLKNRTARGDWSEPYVRAAEKEGLPAFKTTVSVTAAPSKKLVVETLLKAAGIAYGSSPDAALAKAKSLGITSDVNKRALTRRETAIIVSKILAIGAD